MGDIGAGEGEETMSTAGLLARVVALAAAFLAVAAIAAYARDSGKAARGAAPACCIYMIF